MRIRLPPVARTSDPELRSQPVDEAPFPASPVAPAPLCESDASGTEASLAPPFLSLGDAAEWLCVSRSTLKRMITKGEMSTVRVGKRRKIPAGALSAYVARDILLPDQVADIGQENK